MSHTKNNWYVLTGGPSTGKTTLLGEIEKLGHKTVPEAARTVIEEAFKKGISVEELRKDEEHFQNEVIKLKIKLENELDNDTLTFLDRGMQDTLAYMRYYGFKVDRSAKSLFNTAKYRKVFLLEPLPTFKNDLARTEDLSFTKKIHKLLLEAYSEYGMEPIVIASDSLENRLKLILSKVKIEVKV